MPPTPSGSTWSCVNTGFTAAQVTATLARYDLRALIVGEMSADRATGAPVRHDLGELVAQAETLAYPLVGGDLRPPVRPGRTIVLTSGTTATPKGAARREPQVVGNLVSIIERIPVRAHDRMLISAPLFHTWGYAALQLALGTRATIILRRENGAAATLTTLERERVRTWIAVPVQIERVLQQRRTSPVALPALEVVAISGSKLRPGFATTFLDEFGPVLYSLYGSTEVSWATIATPEEFRADPESAGRAPLGTRVAVLGPHGERLPDGQVGRVFVGNEMLFDGYLAGGAPKDTVDGLLDTGDLGVLRDGRLRVTGRADQMIISGGENVYPQELENALFALPEVADAVAVGVPDEDFGARLVAYVVLGPDAELAAAEVLDRVRGAVARHVLPGGAGRCAPSFGERVRQAEPSCLPGCSALRASPGGGCAGPGGGPGKGMASRAGLQGPGGLPAAHAPGPTGSPKCQRK